MATLLTPVCYPLPDNGRPTLSCFALTLAESVRRIDAAHARAEAQAKAENAHPDDAHCLATLTLWHTEFPEGLRTLVRECELFRLTIDLPRDLVKANGDHPLDFWDYAYLCDLLRDALADNPTPPAALRLARALAWVEQAGTALLATQSTILPSEAAPSLCTAA